MIYDPIDRNLDSSALTCAGAPRSTWTSLSEHLLRHRALRAVLCTGSDGAGILAGEASRLIAAATREPIDGRPEQRPSIRLSPTSAPGGRQPGWSLLRAVKHKEAPPEVKAALQTEDGDELQLVGDEMPPDPNQEPIE